mgnify:CR=1 FL=1
MASPVHRAVWLLTTLVCVGLCAALILLPRFWMANVTIVPHGDPTAAAVIGEVRKPDGSPLAGAKITWYAQQGERRLLGATGFRGGELHTTSDAEGRFRFDAVPATEGYAALDDIACGHEGTSRHVLAQLGQRIEGLLLQVEPIEASRWLRGRLRRPDGTPAAFASLQGRAAGLLGNWQGVVSSDAEGRFAIVGPWAEAEVELVLLPHGGEPLPLGSHRFGTTVELTVEPTVPAGR